MKNVITMRFAVGSPQITRTNPPAWEKIGPTDSLRSGGLYGRFFEYGEVKAG
jgi:hypothetical protein